MKKKQIFLNIFFVLLLAGLIVALVFAIDGLKELYAKYNRFFDSFFETLKIVIADENEARAEAYNQLEDQYRYLTFQKSFIIIIIAVSVCCLFALLSLVYVNKNLFPKLTNKIENKVASIQQKSKENKQAKQQLAKQQKIKAMEEQLKQLKEN